MDNRSNPWFGISMGLLGLIVGYALATVFGGGLSLPSAKIPAQVAQDPTAIPSAPPPPPPVGDVPEVTDEDHVRGDRGATISVIEYSDFECPFCQRHHSTMVQLLEQEDDVNWVYRHFPLQFHPNALPAAHASECVSELGGNDAFWQFADLIFEKGFDFEAHVKEIGLNVDAFSDCQESGKYNDLIDAQMAAGGAAGVDGTPGNIVYNNETGEAQIVSGAQPLSSFTSAVSALR
ncbi:disulfide bond formation protein DsbA [Candidatus Peregrinibacteria bacterium CG10_big_fil_rev_8_21_14_0_10_49_16]|nr:MAG: disulfide bond formation protein DsbA [Candidatus Peregrinibacteria bacterium CG10_big_fil_rev_8_21_14_0_10_49_16]